tara:strand:+ start:758 stop:946 length:189 start_codon:yes stop_codon:yes gene_type:complete
MMAKQMGEKTFNDHLYRVIFWNNSGEIKVTAPTTYEDAYKTAESWEGVIYRMEKTQPTKGKI